MVKIPKYLSALPRLGPLELDDVFVFVMPLLLFFLFDFNFFLMLVCSIVLTIVFKKNKMKASRGFLFHIPYMLGARFHGFASVHTRRYRE